MRTSRLSDGLLLVASFVLGGGSLLVFGRFLRHGALGVVDLGLSPPAALAVDTVLSLLFFLQHSGMVREAFQERWAAVVPPYRHAAVYAVTSGIALLILVLFWQGTTPVLFSATGTPLRATLRVLFVLALLGLLAATWALGGMDPLGLRPVRDHHRGRKPRPSPLEIRGVYRWVRHPIYTLTLVLLWAHPDWTADRILFAVLWSLWVVVATHLEEKDLERRFGERYRRYQARVPMFLPRRPKAEEPEKQEKP